MTTILSRKPGGSGGGGGGPPSGPAGGDLAGTYPNPTISSQSSADGAVLMSDGAGGTAFEFPPGHEIGYDQITAPVALNSATEASGTVIITAAAHTFDGGLVIAEFFCPAVDVVLGTNNFQMVVCLFEGATEIGRMCAWGQTNGAAVSWTPLVGRLRFTPTAASHTYKITASTPGGSTNTGGIIAGSGGTAAYVPAYLRFVKV